MGFILDNEHQNLSEKQKKILNLLEKESCVGRENNQSVCRDSGKVRPCIVFRGFCFSMDLSKLTVSWGKRSNESEMGMQWSSCIRKRKLRTSIAYLNKAVRTISSRKIVHTFKINCYFRFTRVNSLTCRPDKTIREQYNSKGKVNACIKRSINTSGI